MKISYLSLPLMACLLLISAGCMGNAPFSTQTPVPTTPQATFTPALPQTPLVSLVPEPTDVMPPTYAVTVQVVKNTIATDPSISVTYEGGQGLAFTQSMTAEVIRSDGTVEQQTVESPQMGSEIVFAGTTGTDRVIVYVTIANGVTYKVFDKDMPFQPINPQY
ncbi:MAG TPA: hypothetical protein PK069_08315 [Methanolinea sp.]|nr:hypothetical protein [Methanolinea sp.]HQK56363.1 hypothetical protein [Methanolinea sp.]